MQNEEKPTACRLCGKSDDCTFQTMKVDEPEMLEFLGLKVDLDIAENPTVCITCHTSLRRHYSFMKNCLSNAVAVKEYREHEETYRKNESETDFGATSYKNDKTDAIISKYCDENDELYDSSKLKHLIKVETQELYIKQEVSEQEACKDKVRGTKTTPTQNIFCSEIDYDIANVKKCENEQSDETELKSEASVETESHEFNLKNEEIEIDTKDSGVASFQDSLLSSHPELKQELTSKGSLVEKMYKCEVCSYATNHKCGINQHMLVHKDTSEIPTYQCEICKFETKHKNSIEKHLTVHRNTSKMFQCDKCNYQTNFKRYWHLHTLFHKKNEVTIYSCEFCTYKTKRKTYLKCHMMIHKDPSEVKTYHCDVCEYKTKYKSSLNRHVLIHSNVPEVKVFSCESCPYTAKHKSSVKRHMLIHKNISEITMYQCDICAFKTRRKSVLHRHMLVHRDAAEVTVFSCELCTYKTKQKDNLKRHSLVHKDTSEVALHLCEICEFRTKHTQSLKTHMQVHKIASEVKMQ